MTTGTTTPQRFKRLPEIDSAVHQFALGQAVRLKGVLIPTGNVYHVTARLPPIGDTPQYRIRNEAEKFERVATQVNLEAVSPAAVGENEALIEQSFRLASV